MFPFQRGRGNFGPRFPPGMGPGMGMGGMGMGMGGMPHGGNMMRGGFPPGGRRPPRGFRPQGFGARGGMGGGPPPRFGGGPQPEMQPVKQERAEPTKVLKYDLFKLDIMQCVQIILFKGPVSGTFFAIRLLPYGYPKYVLLKIKTEKKYWKELKIFSERISDPLHGRHKR